MKLRRFIILNTVLWTCGLTALSSPLRVQAQAEGSSVAQAQEAQGINLLPPLTHTAWRFSQVGEASGKTSIEGDALKITVDVADGTDWHLQLHHDTRNIVNDQLYRLSFEAKADRPRSIVAYGQLIGRQTKGTGLWLKPNLSTEWQTFRTAFQTRDVTNGQHFLPNFLLGAEMGNVWLRNVTLTPVGPAAVAAATASASEGTASGATAGLASAKGTAANANATSANTATATPPVKPVIDPQGWLSRNFEGAESDLVTEADVLKITVTKAGTVNWHANVSQNVKGLQPGQRYVLRGQVRADSPRSVGIYFTTEADPTSNIGLNTGVITDTEWQTFRFPFTARGVGEQGAVLQLLVGSTVGTVWVRGVELDLETATSGTAPSGTASAGNTAPGGTTRATTGAAAQGALEGATAAGAATEGRWPAAQYNTYPNAQPEEYKVLVARISFDDTSDVALPSKEYYETLFKNEWPWLGHYFRSISYGAVRLTGEATELIRLPGSWRDYSVRENGKRTFYSRAAIGKLDAALSKRMSLDGYTHVVYVPNQLGEDSSLRALSSPSPLAKRRYKWSVIPQATGTTSLIHELMHTFSLGHSYVLNSTRRAGGNRWDGGFGNWGEYRHPFTGDSVPGDWIAYSKMRAGWIAGDRIYQAKPGTDTTVRIERLAEPTTNDPLVVVIDPTGTGRTFWTAEARMESGYDAGSIAGEAVVIHECVFGRKHPANMDRGEAAVVGALNPDGTGADDGSRWLPGETYENKAAGFSIKVISRDATGFTLQVKVNPSRSASAQ
jgi:M6 family metalloprotease-like protein